MQYETIEVNVSNAIALVTLNRPKKANSLNALMWQEIKAALNWCDQSAEVGNCQDS
ncbi:enoyl-CoA hydratase-related protein [Iodobacter sp. BJB302]|uniref:enoyl-CoA hydratase-related protein n=1 Tax=Iodobacter sp. BJB302 TaxID=1506510 RepID=UPI00117A5717|nr:enoyl-CoA hydratase-related protein [Iodobacter sp. BJB302]